MINNDKLLMLLKEKYNLNEVILQNDIYKLFIWGKEKEKNYIILKNGVCVDEELSKVQNFIDGLEKIKIKNATFVFIAFVNNDFKKEDYTGFNGNSFLHTISYNLMTSTSMYDKNFYYWGSKKIKQLLSDIEQLFNGGQGMIAQGELIYKFPKADIFSKHILEKPEED